MGPQERWCEHVSHGEKIRWVGGIARVVGNWLWDVDT
jgi:hypothetical protein